MKRPCEKWVCACVDAAEGCLDESFQEHLESCEGCRVSLDELRAGIELVGPEPAPVPGPWLASKIRRQAEDRRQKPTRGLLVLAPMAAAAGLLVLLVTMSGNMSNPSALDPARISNTQSLEDGFFVEEDKLDAMEAEISSYLWDDEWGVGVEMLIGHADADELERLLAGLSPALEQ